MHNLANTAKLVIVLALVAACGGSHGEDAGLDGAATDGAAIDAGDAGTNTDDAAGDGTATDAEPGCNALDFSAFDDTIASFVAAKSLRGASVAVVHRECGVVHTRGYGAFSADRVYLMASSSKIVSTGVLMRLADQQLLDLDAPVGSYLGAWGPNGKPELLVAQMLSNSSGLVGLVDRPLYAPYACQFKEGGTLADCARAIYTAADASDRVPPDTEFHYGGGQWQLAGGIAEAVSGKPWADLLAETYAACGVPSLGYTNQFTKATLAGSPLGYPRFFDGNVATLPVTSNPNVEGGMFINAGDYGKILLMHLRGGVCEGGRVLSEKAVERMRADRILAVYGGSTQGQTGRFAGGSGANADGGAPSPILDGYGLGWWIDRTHPGVIADPGLYGAFPWLDLEGGYGAIIAIEADGDTGAQLFAAAKPALDRAFSR